MKLGHLGSKTRFFFYYFKVMYGTLSSDFLNFFCLGQFLSNYWSYRVIFGTCEVFVIRSVSQ